MIKPHQAGLTLLELLIVLALFTLVFAFGFSGFVEYGNQQRTLKSRVEVESLIKETRNKTLASESTTQFGIYFTPGSVTTFEGLSYSPTNPTNRLYTVAPTVVSYKFSNSSSSITFARLTGEVSATGTISLYDKLSNSTTTITILKSGLLE